MRETFSGPNVITGGAASASSVYGGTPDDAIDGDLFSYCQIRLFGEEYWQYDFPAPVDIRQYTITIPVDPVGDYYPQSIRLEAWTGSNWIIIDSRNGLIFDPGVMRTFSLYELAGTAKFSDGAIAAGGYVNRSDTGAKVGDIVPSDTTGDFSVMTHDAGPFDLLIYRAGYRPLAFDHQAASEA
jgi:hypothetical protein